MPTRDQVLRAYQQHGDYREAAQELGIPAGQAYLVATGVPADGGDTLSPDDGDQPGMPAGSPQALVFGRLGVRSPEASPDVREWIRWRAAADAPMQAAAGSRDAAPGGPSCGVNTGPGGTGPDDTGQPARRWRRKNRAEAPMVPEATFTSLLRQAGY